MTMFNGVAISCNTQKHDDELAQLCGEDGAVDPYGGIHEDLGLLDDGDQIIVFQRQTRQTTRETIITRNLVCHSTAVPGICRNNGNNFYQEMNANTNPPYAKEEVLMDSKEEEILMDSTKEDKDEEFSEEEEDEEDKEGDDEICIRDLARGSRATERLPAKRV
jgi:hypothetical protein